MFSSINLHPQLIPALKKISFHHATPVQEKAIPTAIEGHDLMVRAETGSGKTAAFLIPTLHRLLSEDKKADNTELETETPTTRALILLPTRELALQTQNACEQLSTFSEIQTGLIIGGEDFKKQLKILQKNPQIVIATPGRLVEHIENFSIDLGQLEIFVLDEADRMLDMGFTEDLLRIAAACPKQRQNLLYSATLKNNTLKTISSELLHEPKIISVNNRRTVPSHINQQIILADDTKHKQQLVHALVNEERAKHIIVFCRTRSQCRQLGNYLLYKKIKADVLHGDIPQSDRKKVFSKFANGHTHVLIATDLAARGLDVECIDLVINFEIAKNAEDHIHRCGRTGRAGKSGTAISLIGNMEWNTMSGIERFLKIRFERRKVDGLEGHYKGPKKLKKSGKAAGKKKKKKSKKK